MINISDMTTTETFTKFMSELPAPLTRRGPEMVTDAVLAKRVRQELAAATKAGVFPTDIEFSVRVEARSTSGSLRVDIVRWSGAVLSAAYERHVMDSVRDSSCRWNSGERHSDALALALQHAERIADRHNFDESRSEVDHFHVGYYLNVDADVVVSASVRGIRLDLDPKFAALCLSAQAAAAALDKKVIKSVLGRGGLETAGDYAMERLVKIAARANGRPLQYDKRRGAWVVAQ